jgi:hypothetical protein
VLAAINYVTLCAVTVDHDITIICHGITGHKQAACDGECRYERTIYFMHKAGPLCVCYVSVMCLFLLFCIPDKSNAFD